MELRGGHYSVRLRDVSATTMLGHGHQFAQAVEIATKALGITETDVDDYSRQIESHA
jgi:hypothetical protein